MKKIIIVTILIAGIFTLNTNAKNKEHKLNLPTIEIKDLEFTLPPALYAVPGVDTVVFLDDIILTQTPDKYKLSVKPKIGTITKDRLTISPKRVYNNSKTLEITISGPQTRLKKKIELNTAPRDAGKGQELRLLIIGDSLTAAAVYPKKLAGLLNKRGNPKWTMFGTQKKAGNVAYEGYGGWTWKSFSEKFVKKSVHYTKKGTSPFIFTDNNGKAKLDPARYFKENCDGKIPNIITIMLGINDCFSAQSVLPNRLAVEKKINGILKKSEKLTQALRQAAPGAIIGICLTIAPNSREEAFFANYKGAYHRWTWKQVQHLLVQAQIKHFNNREKENIYIIPTNLSIDPVGGYPVNNGAHPNSTGYTQITATIYAWLKWQFYKNNVAP